MSAAKTERLLNLVICLLATRRPLSRGQIRSAVPAYAAQADEAFSRMFERDKDELRELGVPVVVGTDPVTGEPGYRIEREAYALPAVAFEPDELAVLGLAARVWQRASLSGAASRALVKLAAHGVEPDESSLLGIEPRVRTSEPAFDPLYAAVLARRPVRFAYRAARAVRVGERHVEPWGVVSWRGRWYTVGHDRTRDAERVFRLGRIAGPVLPDGPDGSVVVPPGVDVRARVAVLADDPPARAATLRVRDGAGAALRRRARVAEPADEGWTRLTVDFGETGVLADEIAAHGADVVALDPPELRHAVVERLRGALAGHDGHERNRP